MAFHVPEGARVTEGHPLIVSTAADGCNGAFQLPSPEPGWILIILATDGAGWEHVSVHAARARDGQSRTPSWREMCVAKDTFWDPEDVVVQYHPRRSEYISHHPDTLHLWRPIAASIPTPPEQLVGPRARPGESRADVQRRVTRELLGQEEP